tara:strand:- start:166 stop:450 length:285 start_codon:yes stop_codon:yes gene_type:complete
MENIEKILALSTGHIPVDMERFHKDGNDGYRVIRFKYGFVVWVSYDPDDPGCWQEAEEWFQPIMKYAGENNCTLILFDRDIAVNEELFPVYYDW